jgi:hypothetical protein
MDRICPPEKVYLAARYSRREELRRYAEAIESAGGMVTAGWLYSDNELADLAADPAATAASARRDLADVLRADLCISFTEEPRSSRPGRGGRHVEFGAALAQGLRLAVVGPEEHLFHGLPEVARFESWGDAFATLWPEAHCPPQLASAAA